jgi:hypothetical protein
MNDLEREILIRAHRDVIQLVVVISVAHFDLGIPFGDAVFDAVAEFVSSVIGNDLMIAGDLDLSEDYPEFIRPWTGDAEMITDRIISEWKSLGRNPNLAEICWFDLTERGCVIADELYREALENERRSQTN